MPKDCKYTPSDLIERGPGTLVLDLNQRPLPGLSDIGPEVAVFSGVLEYVQDLKAIIQWLADTGVTTCVTSFDAMPAGLGAYARYAEMKRRSYNGYMSHLTEEQLLESFDAARFTCIHKSKWTNQVILKLLRQQ